MSSPESDQRIPVIIAGLDGISGVTAWSFRLREALKAHPRYRIILINCRETGNRIGDFDYTVQSQSEIRDWLRAAAPAIVIPNFIWSIFDVCAELIAEGIELRCIGFCRADSASEYYNPLTWYEPLIARFAAVSPECALRLAHRINHRKGDIRVMPTGVTVPLELDRAYQTAPLRLVYGGRVVHQQKRVLDFIPLVEILLARGCDFVFDIAGQGRQLGDLKSAMAAINHGGRVRFLGKLPPAEMETIWRSHDVFIQASDFEGTSNSMLESMAQGAVPVVTETESGLAGVVHHGVNGFLVPVGDMAAMADAVCLLAEDKVRLAATGRAACEVAKRFSMEAYAKDFVALLDETMAQPLRTWPPSRDAMVRPVIEGLELPEGPPNHPSLIALATSKIIGSPGQPAREEALPAEFNAPDTIVLVAAADEHFVMPLAAMVKSVLCNLSPERRIVIYIMDGGIQDDSKAGLLDSWASNRHVVRWLQPDWALLENLKITGHVNILTYSRLLIPLLLPERHAKAIYLDSDIIVLQDIGELWDAELHDRHLLAVQDMTAPWMCSEVALSNFDVCSPYLSASEALTNYKSLGIPPRTKYFNAGVLVLDLQKWRHDHTARRIVAYLREHPDHVRWWDQDGLNAVLHDRWGELDLPWNQIPHIFRYPSWRESPFDESDYDTIIRRPKAIHYSARSKPWHGGNDHPRREDFFLYLDMTSWTGWRPSEPRELATNGSFDAWENGYPRDWSPLPETHLEPCPESRKGGTSVRIFPNEDATSAGLEQRLSTPGELAGARLSISMDARCHDRHALALNIHITARGNKKTYSAEHPGHGAWATLRHEIDLPPGTPPERIQCLLVLRPRAIAPALVENFRALAFLPDAAQAKVDWVLPRTVDLRRPLQRRTSKRWNPAHWIKAANRNNHQEHQAEPGDPVFTVILSNYNGAEFLEEALLSVAQQDHGSFEFIIVDDASTDDSRAIIEQVASRFSNRIRTLFKDRNEGQAAGFNDGFVMASGDIICFIDSDDRWFPDKLSSLAQLIEANPGCAIYQHNLYKLVNGTVTEEKFRDVVQTGDLLGYTKRTRHFPYFVPTTGLAFSRGALEAVMPIPHAFRVCADGFLTRTALCYGPIASTNACWGAYRVHGGNNVFENPLHDSFAYTNGLLIPTLNAFYKANGIDLSFEVKAGKKSTGLAPRVRATNRSLLTKILDSSIRELLREAKRRLKLKD